MNNVAEQMTSNNKVRHVSILVVVIKKIKEVCVNQV